MTEVGCPGCSGVGSGCSCGKEGRVHWSEEPLGPDDYLTLSDAVGLLIHANEALGRARKNGDLIRLRLRLDRLRLIAQETTPASTTSSPQETP